jgi:ribosomal-protein-alanine N-acetyltransferase
LHRIDLKVLEYNKRGIRCYEKCGFKLDGVLRDSAFIEGKYHSDLIMSILEDEWRNESLLG